MGAVGCRAMDRSSSVSCVDIRWMVSRSKRSVLYSMDPASLSVAPFLVGVVVVVVVLLLLLLLLLLLEPTG